MNQDIFCPVKGLEKNILLKPINNGYIYFATDTGHIYMDDKGQRVLIGGGQGATVYYAQAAEVEQNAQLYYVISKDDLEKPDANYAIGDILINKDGSFYRISLFPEECEQEIWCDRIAVSGSGGDGSSSNVGKKINIKIDSPETTNLINGQKFSINLTATSATDADGNALDESLQVTWSLSEKNLTTGIYTQYYEKVIDVVPGVLTTVEIGSMMKNNATIKLMVHAYGINSGESMVRSIDFTTASLALEQSENFSNLNLFDTTNVSISCNARGNTDKLLYYYWDDKEMDNMPIVLTASSPTLQTQAVPASLATHGKHTVRIELYQNANGKKGLQAGVLNYEIAVKGASKNPIIWLAEKRDSYYDYENIQILFQVYDPENATATVELYKGNKELESSPKKVTRDPINPKFEVWEIIDADIGVKNTYSIVCGEEERQDRYDINFEVEATDKLKLAQQDRLILKFDATGRTNSESATNRKKWTNPVRKEITEGINAGKYQYDYSGTFTGFNWKKNGWISDENNQTCLRISNGASFDINFEPMEFASGLDTSNSWTIEAQFKVTNLQNYSNLITNYTRYSGDDKYWKAFNEQKNNTNGYTNYDAYLQSQLSKVELEKLTAKFLRVDKVINTEAAICKFYDETKGQGFCLGPQDAFFTTGQNTVNINYVEDEMIYLAIVFSHSNQFVSIYLNGVLTGIVKSSAGNFTINSNKIQFNSKFCDVNLYKMRIYNTNLAVNYIDLNLATDKKDINIYDQTNLAIYNPNLNEYQFDYNAMLEYNNSHPGAEIMPYVIWTTDENGDLPYSKANVISASMEFHNVALDRAYANGTLLEYAKEDGLTDEECQKNYQMSAVEYYYLHHCPSWHGDNIEMKVQGTSSEFYPRRNYKIKTKVKDDEQSKKYVHMFMNKGPFEEKEQQIDWFYYDNYTVGTNKFTMKIDFMESSGSYNIGFANMVNNAYTKHPLDTYVSQGATVKEDPNSSDIKETSEYIEGAIYTYYNHKGNKKEADGTEDNLVITSKEDFELGPYKLYEKLMKENPTVYTKIKAADEKDTEHYNKWYIATIGYKKAEIENTQDYRTSVQGFPVLAFHRKGENGQIKYIGRYNMILDKGSDETYGFAIDNIYQKYADKKPLADIAECWEYSDNIGTFCSFKDPQNRKELSFDCEGSATNGGPLVMDSFEYRYHKNGDYLDTVYNISGASEEDKADFIAGTGVDINNQTDVDKWVLNTMKNWEKACAWVYSTCVDNVPSENASYNTVLLGNKPYEANTYYVFKNDIDQGNGVLTKGYVLDTGESGFDTDTVYYEQITSENNTVSYQKAWVYNPVTNSSPKQYEASKYYIETNGNYVLYEGDFNSNLIYYESTPNSNIAEVADLLVAPATGVFDNEKNTQYYTYNKNKVNGTDGLAVNKVDSPNQEDFNKGLYYIKSSVTYGNKTYEYDTKEYRLAKFQNELTKHFDLDYVATYFVMTEVFECYDSRGKNCMMASWGPQEEGGDYIWYPIFYDIDTQLGINNTGIPSFTFDIDATMNGSFSTNDNILWNNFFTCFKDSYVRQKYRQLRGYSSEVGSFTALKDNAPLKTVEKIEKQYEFDATENGRGVTRTAKTHPFLAMKGERPLIAINLDEYYKYITITNGGEGRIKAGGGYIGQSGTWIADYANSQPLGTYFYALQGDRSSSRQQFLTNRLNYIDSWLYCGAFQRGESEDVTWGRISANIPSEFPDFWITQETDDKKGETQLTVKEYWTTAEDGTQTKTNEFDAEYWINLSYAKPVYTSIGLDNTVVKELTQKYTNTPVKIEMPSSIKNAILTRPKYDEQLLYIYGGSQLTDLGDMSKLYWSEFHLPTDCRKLTRLLLGNDNFDCADGQGYYRKSAQKLTMSNMPLLQEFCLSGVTTSEGGVTYDISDSEKLKSFRALRTDLQGITFADGVALNTLYLPSGITTLKLSQAKQLTKLLTEYPVSKVDNEYNCEEGLYIENLFDQETTNISQIDIDGDAFGYDSYRLLDKVVSIVNKSTNTLNISIKELNWCPYKLLDEGSEYNSEESGTYYQDNKHYGFENYTFTTDKQWKIDILNNRVYKLNQNDYDNNINLPQLTLFTSTFEKNNFKGLNSQEQYPILEGIVYINNSVAEEEADIKNNLQTKYPNLQFAFTNITPAYSAEFKFIEDNQFENIVDVQKLSQKDFEGAGWFTNPDTLYTPKKIDYDFIGWSLQADGGKIVSDSKDLDKIYTKMLGTFNKEKDCWIIEDSQWVALKDPENAPADYNYTFYAIFKIHQYKVEFYDGDNSTSIQTDYIDYGDKCVEPEIIPWKKDSDLDLTQTYSFEGWTNNPSTEKIVDISKQIVRADTKFYPVFKQVSVYDNIHPEYFSTENQNNGIKLSLIKEIRGKLTIPATINNIPVITLTQSFGASGTVSGATSYTGGGKGDNLTHIFFEKTNCQVQTFESYTFVGLANLQYIEIPNSLQQINAHCFRHCTQLQIANNSLGNSLRSIGYQAFLGAFKEGSLTTNVPGEKIILYVPSTIEDIDTGAFQNLKTAVDVIQFGTTESYVENRFLTGGEIFRTSSSKMGIVVYTKLYTVAEIGQHCYRFTDSNGDGTSDNGLYSIQVR